MLDWLGKRRSWDGLDVLLPALGGLTGARRRFPRSYALIVARIAANHGDATLQWLLANDQAILGYVLNSIDLAVLVRDRDAELRAEEEAAGKPKWTAARAYLAGIEDIPPGCRASSHSPAGPALRAFPDVWPACQGLTALGRPPGRGTACYQGTR